MNNLSKLFTTLAIGLCLNTNTVQASDLNNGNLEEQSGPSKTTQASSTFNILRTLAIGLATLGKVDGFRIPSKFINTQSHLTENKISKYTHLLAQKNLNEPKTNEERKSAKFDPFKLANERYREIGTNYTDYVKKLTGRPLSTHDILKIIVPTVGLEAAFLNDAYQNLSPLEFGGGALIAYYAADIEVGIYHYLMDTLDYKNPKVPNSVGESNIFFILHHDAPTDCANYNYWELTYASYKINPIMFAGAGISLLFDQHLLAHIISTAGLIACQGQYWHMLAHRNPSKNSPFVKWLQKHHIILNPQFHNKHHTPPYDSHFGVLTGQMNPVVDLIISAGKNLYRFMEDRKKED